MLTYFQKNPDEFSRVMEILIKANFIERTRLLTIRTAEVGYYTHALAPALEIETFRISNYRLRLQIMDKLKSFSTHEGLKPFIPEPDITLDDPDPEPQPETPPEVIESPEAPQEPETPMTPEQPQAIPPKRLIVCDGCGGLGDTAKFLRWAKVARGEPVTVSYDHANHPVTLSWMNLQQILHYWFYPWSVDTSIRFVGVTNQKGDIHISYKDIDGPGKVLGMAYLPNQSIDFMERGGTLSGDIFIDRLDRWNTREGIHSVGEHEGGHAIGQPHNPLPVDVLYAYSSGLIKPHSTNDKISKTTRYPMIEGQEIFVMPEAPLLLT